MTYDRRPQNSVLITNRCQKAAQTQLQEDPGAPTCQRPSRGPRSPACAAQVCCKGYLIIQPTGALPNFTPLLKQRIWQLQCLQSQCLQSQNQAAITWNDHWVQCTATRFSFHILPAAFKLAGHANPISGQNKSLDISAQSHARHGLLSCQVWHQLCGLEVGAQINAALHSQAYLSADEQLRASKKLCSDTFETLYATLKSGFAQFVCRLPPARAAADCRIQGKYVHNNA